ncbi:MAG: tetratricopeptide repeat protein [Rhodocyclaceae bacterium]|nr:tetratricopeptide repeat protein [Rhodocyclaceae bacterium]
MKKLSLIITLLYGTTMMQGCAWTNPQPPKLTVEPFQTIQHATNRPDGYYRLGRYYQGQNRLDLAAEAYRKALTINPDFTEARNGLGTIYAAQGKYERSLAEFNAALVREPNAAHIHNNIGYLNFLQGNHAEAVAAFTKASALDPANQKARNNLGTALAKIDAPLNSNPVVSQATESAPPPAKPAQPAPQLPFAVLAKPNPEAMTVVLVSDIPPSSRSAKVMPAEETVLNSQPVVNSPKPVASNVVPEKAIPDQVINADPQPKVRKYALEVSNGNGKKLLAAQFSSMLSEKGLPKAKLTDHKPYNQVRTVIQYRKGYLFEAARLSRHLRDIQHLAFVAENKDLPRHTDVKLILGRDLSRNIKIDNSRSITLASR